MEHVPMCVVCHLYEVGSQDNLGSDDYCSYNCMIAATMIAEQSPDHMFHGASSVMLDEFEENQ